MTNGTTAASGGNGTLLDVNNVSFAYPGGSTVLDGISIAAGEGSITGIVGPSGCGKSTLLALLSGLLQPDRGHIRWAPDTVQPPRHPLTMMFQKDTLLPWLNVEDNIGLHFRVADSRLGKAEQKARIAELVRLAGLNGAERKFPYQLSGGMRRRTAFLASVAPHPRTLLLDEPFSALDEPTRIGIHQDIFNIVKREGITVILITHDLGEAISLSDQVLVLTAQPATVYRRFDIPFGNERNFLELRESTQFLELYGHVWEQLAVQIQNSRAKNAALAGGAR
jgi:ABC-type nitrate/sulfonate/bicarbonate transport system ATPase subunit